jgi:hypothetical protein
MPRKRSSENRGYPKSWRFRYDAYYYRVPKGQEHLWDGKREFHLGVHSERLLPNGQNVSTASGTMQR